MRIAEVMGFGFFIVLIAGIFSVVLMILQFALGFMGIDLSNIVSYVEATILVMIILLGLYVLLVYAPSVIQGR